MTVFECCCTLIALLNHLICLFYSQVLETAVTTNIFGNVSVWTTQPDKWENNSSEWWVSDLICYFSPLLQHFMLLFVYTVLPKIYRWLNTSFYCNWPYPPQVLRIWYIPHKIVNGNLACTTHPVLCGGFRNMGISCCQGNTQHHTRTR